MKQETTIHNNKTYIRLDDNWGSSLAECVKQLQYKSVKDKDNLYYINFNDDLFYSDEVTLDSAYKQIFDKTYGEYLDYCNKNKAEIELMNEEFERNIPELIEHYKKTGKKILIKKYYKHYEEMIPLSLKGTYKGWELIQSIRNN